MYINSMGLITWKRILCVLFLIVSILLLRDLALASDRLLVGVPLFANDAPVEEDFVNKLKRFLRPGDILFVRGQPRVVRLLKNAGDVRVAVIRQSIPDLKKDLDFLLSQKARVDYLCYNPEAWKSSHTPQEEKDDPVKAAMEARRLADEHGLGLIIVTDTMKTLPAYGAEMAEHADFFGIQFQRWQRLEGSVFKENVSRSISQVKRGNPDIKIIAQLSVNPPLAGKKEGRKIYGPASSADILAKIEAIESMIDGAGFLLFSKDRGFERFFEVLGRIRSIEVGPR